MIYIASDHVGFELKSQILQSESMKKYELNDLGPYSFEYSDDYVDFAIKVCTRVQSERDAGIESYGILICGSGEGMMIAANKFRGIYAALCDTSKNAVLSKQHNNSNVLVIGAELSAELSIHSLLIPWLDSTFSNLPRHIRRIEKIKNLEEKFYK